MKEVKEILLEVGDKLVSNKGQVLVVQRTTKTKAVAKWADIKRVCMCKDGEVPQWDEWGKRCDMWTRPTKYTRWTQKGQDAIDFANRRNCVNNIDAKSLSKAQVDKIYEILQEEGA